MIFTRMCHPNYFLFFLGTLAPFFTSSCAFGLYFRVGFFVVIVLVVVFFLAATDAEFAFAVLDVLRFVVAFLRIIGILLIFNDIYILSKFKSRIILYFVNILYN